MDNDVTSKGAVAGRVGACMRGVGAQVRLVGSRLRVNLTGVGRLSGV